MKPRQVVGIHAAREVLKVRPKAVRTLRLKQGWRESRELLEISEVADKFKIRIETVPPSVLDKISRSHQGVYVEVASGPEFPWQSIAAGKKPEGILGEGKIVLALDGLEDPQNVGALMRSAWLFGAAGILVSEARSVHLTATVSKIASGGAEHVPFEVVTNLASSLKVLKEKGFWIFGLAGEGNQKLFKMTIPQPAVWVIGSEEKGLRSSVRSVCDELVAIDQIDATASFNASVAGAIALAETCRQWEKGK